MDDSGRISGSKITLSDTDGVPEYDSIEGMAHVVLEELLNQNAQVHKVGYGGLVHIVNHAAAIVDLNKYGYPELAEHAALSSPASSPLEELAQRGR